MKWMGKSYAAMALGAALCLLLTSSNTSAQCLGLAGRWFGPDGNPVTNPGSTAPLFPWVTYDPSTGIVSLWNVGWNRQVDTVGNTTIAGDDIGMISLLVPVVDPNVGSMAQRLIGGPSGFQDGVLWNTFAYFNGKVQLGGTPATGQFAPISNDPIPVFQLPAGLDFSIFGPNPQVEMGINFGPNQPGGTLFCEVPEPSGLAILGATILLAPWCRRAKR